MATEPFPARSRGLCTGCGEPVYPGDLIRLDDDDSILAEYCKNECGQNIEGSD